MSNNKIIEEVYTSIPGITSEEFSNILKSVKKINNIKLYYRISIIFFLI
jgi:hypothetical protein